MATSSTSAASVASLLAPPTFTGVSKFATSLQQVLTRAVGIASLPLGLDQAALTSLNTTQSDLQGLDTVFTTLQQSVSSLQSTLASNLLTASLSDSSTVSTTIGAGATAGTYTIAVGSLGAYSTALSNAGSTPVTDPATQGISSSSTFTLTVGTATTTITPASSDLQDLDNAINSQSNGQVQATLVNVGSTSSPDYRLSLQAAKLGTDAIDLTDSSNLDLISTSTPGKLASYQIDGSAPIDSNSRSVTLSTGLTVNLLAQSAAGASTTITVADDPSGLASAFSAFAGSYNAAVDAIAQYHGQGGGALEGDSLVQTLTNALDQLGTYNNGSPVGALANFGITLDEVGQLSVDTTAFTAAADANFPTLLSTLGSATGGGFLGAATSLLTGIEDPTAGTLKTEETSVAGEIKAAQTTVANEQATVNLLQTNLTQQISKADSTIAELESQVSYVTGLFAVYTGANSTQSNGLATL
jgi:flagellar hook-associated protein 2